MKYKEALGIGYQAEGTIQCTFAVIYDQNKKPLFALQRRNFEGETPMDRYAAGEAYYKYLQNGWSESGGGDHPDIFDKKQSESEVFVYTGYGREGIIAWQDHDYNFKYEGAAKGLITFDMPLVVVDEYSDKKLVPAKLLYPAVEYIKKTLASSKNKTKYILWEKDPKTGESRKLGEQYTKPDFTDQEALIELKKKYEHDPIKLTETLNNPPQKENFYYTIDSKGLYPYWQDLYDLINEDDVVYVKPAAFRWEVTKLRQFAGDTTQVNEQTPKDSWLYQKKMAYDKMMQAKAKYDRMKLIAGAAGMSNLI